MKLKGIFYIICSFFICSSSLFSQNAGEAKSTQDTTQQTRVFLEHANTLSYNKDVNPDAQILNGEVCFRHDSSYMYCDSAYFYELTNSLEAFSNVRMEQGDTLFVYGSYLYYDGNTQIANLRENVRMENGQITLFADSLNYDRGAGIGYYFEGGLIVDEENELSSFYGQYSPATKLAIFNEDVRLENSDFILYSDTLHYLTDTKVADIIGPSTIESDSGVVYTSRGWYNTENDLSLLLDRSRIESGDKWMTGDSIIYNRDLGLAEAFGNIFIQDTARQIVLEGEYGLYNEQTEYAFTTENARFLEYGQGDTLYLHADTLEMLTVDDDREVKAFYGVRFYRSNLQGVCDSLQFNTRDSVLYMFDEPILWNAGYQLYGDTILIYMNDSTIDHAHVKRFAFAIQEVDSSYYNQLKGNDLKAFFKGQSVRQIDIEENAESIFYPIENDGAMVGMNETRSGFLTIWVNKDNKLERLKIWPTPQGILTPIPDLRPDQKTLKDFFWYDYMRPKDKDDIFIAVNKRVEDAPKRSNKFTR